MTHHDMFGATFHRDGSVTFWHVYEQAWRRLDAEHIADETLATMSQSDRDRIARIIARRRADRSSAAVALGSRGGRADSPAQRRQRAQAKPGAGRPRTIAIRQTHGHDLADLEDATLGKWAIIYRAVRRGDEDRYADGRPWADIRPGWSDARIGRALRGLGQA